MVEEFGFQSCLPIISNAETGTDAFLQRNPNWDGRGVVIAVLDTGVDPNAHGLQKTTEEKAKLLDIIDATGSGDVDTSCIRKTDVSKGRMIKSLNEQLIHIPDDWCNPTGEWHVGLKNESELFPEVVKARAKDKFITDVWNPKHSQLKAKILKEIEEFDCYHTDADIPVELKLKKENMEASIEILDKLSKTVLIPGAALDCIAFHDGHSWSVAIIKNSNGCQEFYEVLKPFKETGQTIQLGDVTVSVNVYDDGNTVSVVSAAGAHGTHVASIAAAHDADCQEQSGVAPGAQIISIKIGDSRLGTMETATSLMRACSLAVSSGADLINFSYGEASHWTNKGAVLEFMAELCQKHNVVFVASAGNNGPALSTVGCPGGNTKNLIGVGAFVSPKMMCNDYSMTRSKPSLPFTWSSRGPALDGDLGVSVAAPGGAIMSVPLWTLKKKQLMNGTSMSSPYVCGCIALLLSALKSHGISYNPAFIKRVIENTAVPLGKHDPFSIGHGVIQVEKAYNAAIKAMPSYLVDFQVTVSGGVGRGIYLREPWHILEIYQASIAVEPKFTAEAETKEKVAFELQLALVSSASWVVAPKHLKVWNGARHFKVEVDPRNLPSGVHYAQVMAYLPGDDTGPLFRVPVTVIIPEQLTNHEAGYFSVHKLVLEKNNVSRFFFHVPKEASWADLKLSNFKCEGRARITVHTVQIAPERSFRENENNETVNAEKDRSSELILRLIGGYTMELCLSLYWSELENVTLSLEMTFHFVHPSTTSLTFNSSNMWTSVDVTSFRNEEEIYPEFKLTHSLLHRRPTSHKISPLGSRDILPNGVQVFQLVLTYSFHLNQTTEVWPQFPLISDLLYENPYSGQLWMIFNSKKQYKCAGDAYPRHYTLKLDKDDYILKLQVCHSKVSELKKLTHMPLCLHLKLPSSVTLEVTASRYELMSGLTITNKTLRPGIRTTLFLRPIPEEKFAKCGVHNSDMFSGWFSFSKSDKVKKKVSYELRYIVGPRPETKSESVPSPKKANSREQYDECLKDLKITWMKNGVLSSRELEEEYGEDLSFLLARLKMLCENETGSHSSVEALAAKVYAKIDINEILAYIGIKAHMTQGSKKDMLESRKRQLVECLLMEGSVLIQEQPLSDRLKTIYIDLHKLLEKKDDRLRAFKMKYAEVRDNFATLIKLIEEEVGIKGASKELDKKLVLCYRQLNCNEYADLLEQSLIWKYPPNFVPF